MSPPSILELLRKTVCPCSKKALASYAEKIFFVGYSPERINPGDKIHTFEEIIKVVSGQNEATAKIVADVYSSVVKAGVHIASSIKVAEAGEIIENTQRDINIALMNELSLIFHRIGIDTLEVLAAARTKWNFLPFSPGLVGGHCIGVDPYYLTHLASRLGYTPQVILAGRRINDEMGSYIASQIIKKLSHTGRPIQGSTLTILGLTFKETFLDIRNTKVADIIRELKEYGVDVQIHDPHCDPEAAMEEYGVEAVARDRLRPCDVVVLAVAHREFAHEGWKFTQSLLKKTGGLVFDLKGTLDKSKTPENVSLWRL